MKINKTIILCTEPFIKPYWKIWIKKVKCEVTGWKAKRGRIYDKRCGVIPALEKVSIYNCFCGILMGRGLLTPRFSPHLCRALSCRLCGALKPCCPALLPCAPGCGHIQHMAVLTNCFIRYFDGKRITYTPPLYHPNRLPFIPLHPQIPPSAGR